MQSYKLTIAYDGTDYYGWQWQTEGKTVERVIREAFLSAFHQKEVFFVGASRTDAGVHAQGQVARLRTIVKVAPEKLALVLNNALPDDIVIKEVSLIDEQFHPQHNVLSKTYEYLFFTQRPDPEVQRFGWYVPFALDGQKLARCLALFTGTHDFRAFCKEEQDKDTVRTIDTIALSKCEKTGGYRITIQGKSFLRFMIRRIVGAALTAATKITIRENDLKRTLLEKKLLKVLPTAPAKGLSLKKIDYINS